MQLGEAEALGMLDDHDRGVRHVDADLDDGGGDEDAGFAVLEGAHRLVLLGALHAAMDEADRVAEILRRATAKRSSADISLISSDSSTSGQIQ